MIMSQMSHLLRCGLLKRWDTLEKGRGYLTLTPDENKFQDGQRDIVLWTRCLKNAHDVWFILTLKKYSILVDITWHSPSTGKRLLRFVSEKGEFHLRRYDPLNIQTPDTRVYIVHSVQIWTWRTDLLDFLCLLAQYNHSHVSLMKVTYILLCVLLF